MAFRYLCQNGLSAVLFSKTPRTSLMVDCKRFLKPRKAVQYKQDWRMLADKEYTHEPIELYRLGGRDPTTGKKHNQRVGGGIKLDYYWITAYPFLPKEGEVYEERVLEVRRDPNRSPYIALLAGSEGRRWIIATDGMKAGDIYRTNNIIPDIPVIPKVGEAWPVGAVADGTEMCVVEVLKDPVDFSEMRAYFAGSFVTVTGRKGDLVVIKLRHEHELLINKHCMGTVGHCSNPNYSQEWWGSINMKRRLGVKQGSGKVNKKDGYYGRKIKRPPPPLLVERRQPPPERYVTSITAKQYSCKFGVGEYNPVLKGG